jgi:very-short-patch-repair endonuclease
VIVHRVRRLHEDDGALVDGIPVTGVARTLLDLADVVPQRLDRALEAAERLGLFDLAAVDALIARSRGHHGLGALAKALRDYREPPHTDSEMELDFVRLCRNAGLPAPSTSVLIAGHRVDAVWQQQRLVVELDGREFHRTRAAFERDRMRDADLQVAGYRVLRITHRRLTRYPGAVVNSLRLLLSRATTSSSCTEASTSAANSSRSAIAS